MATQILWWHQNILQVSMALYFNFLPHRLSACCWLSLRPSAGGEVTWLRPTWRFLHQDRICTEPGSSAPFLFPFFNSLFLTSSTSSPSLPLLLVFLLHHFFPSYFFSSSSSSCTSSTLSFPCPHNSPHLLLLLQDLLGCTWSSCIVWTFSVPLFIRRCSPLDTNGHRQPKPVTEFMQSLPDLCQTNRPRVRKGSGLFLVWCSITSDFGSSHCHFLKDISKHHLNSSAATKIQGKSSFSPASCINDSTVNFTTNVSYNDAEMWSFHAPLI